MKGENMEKTKETEKTQKPKEINTLYQEIGVTPAHQKKFIKSDLQTVHDFFTYFPRQYLVYGSFQNTLEKHYVCFSGIVIRIKVEKTYCMATVQTKEGIKANVFWFQNRYMNYHLPEYQNATVYVCGKAEYNSQYRSYTVTPDIFSLSPSAIKYIRPVYKAILKIDSDTIHGYILRILDKYAGLQESIPEDIRLKYGLVTKPIALQYLHNPQNPQHIVEAQKYFTIELLYEYAKKLKQYNKQFSNDTDITFPKTELVEKIINQLPFTLTQDQDRIVHSFLKTMQNKTRLQALVQGDVSCGKTIIAHLSMVAAAENGYQSVMIAPTTILAEQHYTDLCKLIEQETNLHCVLITGNTKLSEKKKLLKQIKNNKCNLIIGTTSVLSDSVEYANLGLVITDEEHRFGVEQKEILMKNGIHMISMSATPIPRTLAQVIYSNVKVEVVNQMPPGRIPVATYMTHRDISSQWIESERRNGHKAYIICPQIDHDEERDVVSVEQAYQDYRHTLSHPEKIACINGKMKSADIQERIKEFRDGIYDVLISTTVVEVGVNVPDATVIVIEDADIFGLSQLHQLRGRVGRSSLKSFCFLLPREKITEDGKKRLYTLCQTNNGMEIAQVDVEMRGMGEITGSQQSGKDNRLLTAIKYPQTFQELYQYV